MPPPIGLCCPCKCACGVEFMPSALTRRCRTYSVCAGSRLVLNASASVCVLSTSARPPYSNLCCSGVGLDGIFDWIWDLRLPTVVLTGYEPRSNESWAVSCGDGGRLPGGTLILTLMCSGGAAGGMLGVLLLHASSNYGMRTRWRGLDGEEGACECSKCHLPTVRKRKDEVNALALATRALSPNPCSIASPQRHGLHLPWRFLFLIPRFILHNLDIDSQGSHWHTHDGS